MVFSWLLEGRSFDSCLPRGSSEGRYDRPLFLTESFWEVPPMYFFIPTGLPPGEGESRLGWAVRSRLLTICQARTL